MLQDALKTMTIYDKNDQEAGTLSAQKGTYINLGPGVYHYPWSGGGNGRQTTYQHNDLMPKG